MKLTRLVPLVAAFAVLGGCNEHDRLAEVERELAPTRGEKAADCLKGGSFGIDYPSYACTYYVPGTRSELTLRMADRLEGLGFVVRCGWDDEGVEIQAGRDTLDVYVDISQQGSMLGFSEAGEPLDIYAPGGSPAPRWARAIPEGTVVVRINVSDYGEYRWPDESAPECDRAFLVAGEASPVSE